MTKDSIWVALLCLPLVCRSAEPQTNAPVTVVYEGTYVTQPDGKQTQKVAMIPWTNGLTIIEAIVTAGGYSTPPHRYGYLVRDGRRTLLPDPRQAVREEDVLRLQAGDRIELRTAQNNTSEGIRRPADGSPKPSR